MASSTKRIILAIAACVVAVAVLTCVGLAIFLGPHILQEYDENWKGTSSFDDAALLSQSQQIGDSIIDALHQYRERHGKYPSQLERLVPEFLDEVPQPKAGYGEWNYSGDTDGFELAFGVGSHCYPCAYRDESSAKWYVDG